MLHIHRAERADRLLDGLAGVLAEPLADPLQAEVIAVPTRGVERWLTQRLSARLGASAGRGDGVCANVDFPFPGRLVGDATATATGVDRDSDPWRPERAVWPLLEVVAERLDEPWLATLRAHLGGGPGTAEQHRRARRFAVVRHLADLYDRYGVHRPAMLRAWATGADTDGAGAPLATDVAWQAQLWRTLGEVIGAPSPAERLAVACDRLEVEPAMLDLPDRIGLFGLTRLPASFLDVLGAIAASRDVHLFLLHPSAALWQRIAGQLDGQAPPRRRSADPTATTPSHPLLWSWGRDAREMQLVLAGSDAGASDHHWPLAAARTTALEHLQAAVRADTAPPGVPLPGQPDLRPALAPDDDSVTVHACHGRARQVEVLRDAILHLLARHDHLEPRDVIVMCPDVETFAPLIHAAFGAAAPGFDGGEEEPLAVGTRPEGLRVRLADRSLRQTNPVLRVVSDLLELVDGRVTASQVLDLADREPVRRRFGFDDEDLERVTGWVAAAGIRWGIDAAHRKPFQLGKLDANTWRTGLRRLLAGVALPGETPRLVGGTLPLDDVGSGDIDLAGRLVELIERLESALARLRIPQPLADWADALTAAADALTSSEGTHDWQRSQLQRLLDEVVREARRGGDLSSLELSLAEVQALLADRLRGRPTRANFRTGHLTICTLVPMRSVPHKVVCLLGLDDGQFPRRTAVDGDDIIGREPYVGDRDPRAEDRQLLLDALLAATEHLVITYTGRDERTNAARPPAVPVGELLDALDATVRVGEGSDRARERLVIAHPLQPFDPRNFTPQQRLGDRRWSFDEVALAGARALVTGPGAAAPFLAKPLDPLAGASEEVVELAALESFLRHPVRAFLRQRLGVSLYEADDELLDDLPVDLDGLGKWGVGDRLLADRLAGYDETACAAAERARSLLPPGRLGGVLMDEVGPQVEQLVAAAGEHLPNGERTALDVAVRLADGSALVGNVGGVIESCLTSVAYSRVGAKHRLVAWARLLAATAAHPERPLEVVTIGKRIGRGGGVSVVRIPPLAASVAARREAALAELEVLIDLYRRGMREPLPLYCDTSLAYAKAATGPSDPANHAGKAWTSEFSRDNEDKDPHHQLVHGGVATITQLLGQAPREDECGEDWPPESSRLGRYARRLWGPLLARELEDSE